MLDNLKKYKVILASNSPRRKELLAGLGVDYEVRTLPDVDESYPDTLQGCGYTSLYRKRKSGCLSEHVATGRTDDNCRHHCLAGRAGAWKT